jgi:hypothetical protein
MGVLLKIDTKLNWQDKRRAGQAISRIVTCRASPVKKKKSG